MDRTIPDLTEYMGRLWPGPFRTRSRLRAAPIAGTSRPPFALTRGRRRSRVWTCRAGGDTEWRVSIRTMLGPVVRCVGSGDRLDADCAGMVTRTSGSSSVDTLTEARSCEQFKFIDETLTKPAQYRTLIDNSVALGCKLLF